MNKKEKLDFVKNYKTSRFFRNNENDLCYISNNKKVEDLCVIVDFSRNNETPVCLKYGNYTDLTTHFHRYEMYPQFFKDVELIHIPLDMYLWVDVLFDISASNWAFYLKEILEDKNIIDVPILV